MKKVLSICLMLVMFCSSLVLLSACENWDGYLEVTNRAELLAAVENVEVDKIKVVSGNYGSAEDYQNITITRPVTIKGAGEKPVLFGGFVIKLADDVTEPVVIENLEISHSGVYVAGDLTIDGRRGVLVKNGSVTLKNNYIHLTDEAPETKYYAASTGIQLSVAYSNASANQLTYVIENNRIGKYNQNQTTATSLPAGINAVIDNDGVDGTINLTRSNLDEIYSANTFDEGTEIFYSLYNYIIGKYEAAGFNSEATANRFTDSINEGLEIREVNGIWKVVEA